MGGKWARRKSGRKVACHTVGRVKIGALDGALPTASSALKILGHYDVTLGR